jgi:hypothetical protein
MPVAAGLGYYFFVRPQMLKMGTRMGESERRLPGDDVIATPNFQTTHAIDIDAPAESIWPWLAQIGRDRTGFYGIDNVTNGGVPSIAYLRQDLPVPAAGMALDGGHRLLDVEPNRLILFGGFDLPTWTGEPTERTTLFLLEPRADGTSRLIIRTRGYAYGPLAMLYNLLYEVVDYGNAMAQLQNIKVRAEMMAHLRLPAATGS